MSPPFRVLIPARRASSRLPDKVLAEVAGRPLILHVLDRARASGAVSVHVATDSEAVADRVLADGGDVVMTSAHHRSGTDRLAEAVSVLGFDAGDIVVNLQGDEPAMPIACLIQVAELLAEQPEAQMATLWSGIEVEAEWRDPNVVKLVADHAGRALYFSRASVPHPREGGWPRAQGRRHVGLYAYRAGALAAWRTLAASPLEQLESLEQLRALQAGWWIATAEAAAPIPVGIDTPEDLARFRASLSQASV
ncbi:3-deoxy-manno-octulosonate cytidylyltransferase [Wenzhouxiangella marina]|uniref:3-deoxy-manno-octulosonate cytidylyltransferase n=1 Tax=Wenzhouxiangella marina TaxID=1579979 RepID=A0A0K0XWY0_9GAMM|nr:3-deoxy-manno-octulosonate cytidylyltransferase [Wenzhouxiangella marina]AKS42188.1 3-deoxy-manno-octulosonate cytidylyltransferase [Wenzhouxiangella marina]MBB6086040.1 3-deoxy-manno-octulosonate cytidylyltransferase (CMP-KDO synthetase) [Wenzhouxiangella marina]